MASPQPIYYPITHTHMLPWMPSPCREDSLWFQGKDIDGFLSEYKHFADHASLIDERKCQGIQVYFSKKEKHVLDVLKGYIDEDWQALKEELKSLYTLSAEKKMYQPRDIQWFITKKRDISKLLHFDAYWHEFLVITVGLEARQALSGYDWDDCFWSGIQPTSLWDVLDVMAQPPFPFSTHL